MRNIDDSIFKIGHHIDFAKGAEAGPLEHFLHGVATIRTIQTLGFEITDNQLASGDGKPRFCGRGGYGGVMASKNLWAIAADGPNPGRMRGLREVNKEINLGEGSARYRDLPHDRGGTWRTMKMMQEAQSLPEYNFVPTGTDASVPLLRPSVETGPYDRAGS